MELFGAHPDDVYLPVGLALEWHQLLEQRSVVDVADDKHVDVALGVDAAARPGAEDRCALYSGCLSEEVFEAGLNADRLCHEFVQCAEQW